MAAELRDAVQRPATRYRVSVREFVTFQREGFLVVRGLVPPEDIAALRAHCEEIVAGRIGRERLGEHVQTCGPEEAEAAYNRIHMLHRHLPLHERYLLHPRVLDVLEALIGPDVLALQTMLFLKPPGAPGQGYHQDSYYIPVLPDSLCGAWIAIDRADEENGCVWFTAGSQAEPVYPARDHLVRHHAGHTDAPLGELAFADHASDPDEARNELAPIARRYAGREVPAVADPGDVVFFGGHVLHRSHTNRSADRWRRSFVGHYCNARSFTQWDYGFGEGCTNGRHILARGTTHLPFAQPLFGTPCAATRPAAPEAQGPAATAMADAGSGMMDTVATDPERLDPAAHRH